MVSASAIKATSAVMTSVITVNATLREVEMGFGAAVHTDIELGRPSGHSFGAQFSEGRYKREQKDRAENYE